MTLASKLPLDHPFSGGYPRIGGQPLPTDPDAIDYLNRVAAADGAAVEVGVAMAVDAFIKGCKADGTWSALKASCIMCGARTIAGALVPLVGAAPTPYNFAGGDYSRSGATPGLKGNGSTKYLQTGLQNTSLAQNDAHCSVYATLHESSTGSYMGAFNSSTGDCQLNGFNSGNAVCRFMASSGELVPTAYSTPFLGMTRSDATGYTFRGSGANSAVTRTSGTPTDTEWCVFNRSTNAAYNLLSNARLAFYSIGSSLDLAALDDRVSTLVAAIAAAL